MPGFEDPRIQAVDVDLTVVVRVAHLAAVEVASRFGPLTEGRGPAAPADPMRRSPPSPEFPCESGIPGSIRHGACYLRGPSGPVGIGFGPIHEGESECT